jgi:hypothetical protein
MEYAEYTEKEKLPFVRSGYQSWGSTQASAPARQTAPGTGRPTVILRPAFLTPDVPLMHR